MRAVLVPNVIVSAVLAPSGSPARVLKSWFEGKFDLIASPRLLAELERVLGYSKIRSRISEDESADFLELLRRQARFVEEPDAPSPIHPADPGDEYLIVLAAVTHSVIVSGDHHLLDTSDRLPVFTSTAFLELLAADN
jgi:putative PIN family toxin of toxin-antitoxin system